MDEVDRLIWDSLFLELAAQLADCHVPILFDCVYISVYNRNCDLLVNSDQLALHCPCELWIVTKPLGTLLGEMKSAIQIHVCFIVAGVTFIDDKTL